MIKRILSITMIFTSLILILSCKKDKKEEKDKDCTTCMISEPEAKAEFNNSTAGVYKGIITGSSGIITFYIGNKINEYKAVISFDGKDAVLNTSSLTSWTPGSAIDAEFTGTLNGKNISATLTVGIGGQSPSVQLVIPGHTAGVYMYKETSGMLVKGYEGTFAGDKKGTLNIVMAGTGYAILTDNGEILIQREKLIGGKIKYKSSGQGYFAGDLLTLQLDGEFTDESQNSIKGEWKTTEGPKGAWEAKRTL